MEKKKIINDIIRNRRSIFPSMFSDEKIDDKIILDILENARWAPNHKMTEPWKYIVFTRDTLKDLSDFCGEAYRKLVPPDKFSEMKYNKTKKKILSSSHVIAVCLNRSVEINIPEWEELAALAMSVQNLWLSVSAYGLGGYWSSPKYISIANEFLKLKENQSCMGFFYLGVPQPNIELKSERKPLLEKVTWFTA